MTRLSSLVVGMPLNLWQVCVPRNMIEMTTFEVKMHIIIQPLEDQMWWLRNTISIVNLYDHMTYENRIWFLLLSIIRKDTLPLITSLRK